VACDVAVGTIVRTGHEGGLRRAGLAKRVLSAVVFVPALLWLLLGWPAALFSVFVVLLGIRAQWEFVRMFERDGVGVYRVAGVLLGGAVTASFHVEGAAPLTISAVVVGLMTLPLLEPGPPRWAPTALTLLGVCYVNWMLGYAIWLRGLPGGVSWIVFLLAVTWSGETAAYLVGARLGRHPLAPAISPAKTIEGALAQLLVSVAAGGVSGLWLFGQPAAGLAGGLLLGVVGQCGDLAESVLKRSAHTKDTGELIPGHGGLLDRLDSLLFNTPALFYYARHIG
jgi:phosphatidate cytidylyltransferase